MTNSADYAKYLVHLATCTIDMNNVDVISDETDTSITIDGHTILTGEDARMMKEWLDRDHERFLQDLESEGTVVVNRTRLPYNSSILCMYPPAIDDSKDIPF